MENSHIQWTHHTFNAWLGCTKVSEACKLCYAERMAKRICVGWGPEALRRALRDAYWRDPIKWNRQAERAGQRYRVFCGSMMDVMDDKAPEGQRERLWELIGETPNLDWLLLSKRPENYSRFLPWSSCPDNVWLGSTVENQTRADQRIPLLLQVKARVHFLSVEPMLGPLTLRRWSGHRSRPGHSIDWVIAGGESGALSQVRPTELNWVRDLRDECSKHGIPFFFKQTGILVARELGISGKGGEWSEIPGEFRIRDYPQPSNH